MAQPAAIVVRLSTESSAWSKGLGDAGKDVQSFVNKAQGQFKALSFDSGNSINAGGILKAVGALDSVGKAAVEVATSIRNGGSAGEAFANILSKTPIGPFISLGNSIRELVTGEKAAAIETAKLNEHLNKTNDIYRSISQTRAAFGKFGDEKAKLDIDKETNERITALHKQQEEITKAKQEIEKHDDNIGYYSAAQKREMKRLDDEKKAIGLEIQVAGEARTQKEKDLKRERAQTELEYTRSLNERTIASEAAMTEKSLKRQGKALESAITAVKADRDKNIRELEASLDPYKLEGMDEGDKAARIKATNEAIAKEKAKGDETVDTLEAEDARRKQELALDNQEKLKEIQAKGNQESLKLQDEHINTSNELNGNAQRSHLAEAATIEEEYRKQIAEIEKHAREERAHGFIDPEAIEGQKKAAEEQRKQAMGLLKEKGTDEFTKNQNELIKEQRKLWEQSGDAQAQYAAKLADINDHFRKFHDAKLRDAEIAKLDNEIIKEQRKLWEEVGTPQDKYAAKMADINEHFEKFHNQKLKDAEIEKLDKATILDLEKQNPNHDPNINLYNRSQSLGQVTEGKGDEIARTQLEEMKKAGARGETLSTQMRDIWDYFRKQLGPFTEISI
jgi:colicin import membrane protein